MLARWRRSDERGCAVWAPACGSVTGYGGATVKVSVSFHNITDVSKQGLRELCEEHARHIERRHLASFRADLVRIEGRIEKSPSHHLYRVGLRLKLPSRVLATAAEEHNVVLVLREAFDELDRLAEKHVARLRRAHLWKRVARRRRLEELKHRAPHQGELRQVLFELIQPHLDALFAYVRRELRYEGFDGASALDAADIVAGTLLRALERPREPRRQLKVRGWLLALAHEEIAAQLQNFWVTESIEAPADEGHEEPTVHDEERYEYWEPEEQLTLEDLLPDPTAETPEEAAMQNDLRRALLRAIATLPRSWRHAVILTTFDGLAPAEAAGVLGISEAQLNQKLEHAQAFLKQRLADIGLAYEPKGADIAALAELGRISLSSNERAEILKALGG